MIQWSKAKLPSPTLRCGWASNGMEPNSNSAAVRAKASSKWVKRGWKPHLQSKTTLNWTFWVFIQFHLAYSFKGTWCRHRFHLSHYEALLHVKYLTYFKTNSHLLKVIHDLTTVFTRFSTVQGIPRLVFAEQAWVGPVFFVSNAMTPESVSRCSWPRSFETFAMQAMPGFNTHQPEILFPIFWVYQLRQ